MEGQSNESGKEQGEIVVIKDQNHVAACRCGTDAHEKVRSADVWTEQPIGHPKRSREGEDGEESESVDAMVSQAPVPHSSHEQFEVVKEKVFDGAGVVEDLLIARQRPSLVAHVEALQRKSRHQQCINCQGGGQESSLGDAVKRCVHRHGFVIRKFLCQQRQSSLYLPCYRHTLPADTLFGQAPRRAGD